MKLSFYLSAILLLLIAEPAFTACTCDPDTSYGTPTEFTGPYAGTGSVDVDLGNTPANFAMAAYWQIFGSAPPGGVSGSTIQTQVTNLTTLPYWRRVDTVNSFLLSAGSSKAKTYSNRWPNQYQFTTAPCKNNARDIGAVCMFFFTCPAGSPGWVNCGMDWANTHDYGMTGFDAMENDNNNPSSNGLLTSSSNVGFWYRELMDARYAGLQFLMPNAYGPDITNGSIDNLATALGQISGSGITSQVRIALFDDTSGWGTASYGAPWSTAPNMASTAAAAAAIYNDKWKPFFSKLPSQYWYTVGGRPLIYFYNGSSSLGTGGSAAVIQAAKALFAQPVASGGFGVTPYVVVDRYYFADGNMNLTGTNADNEFIWDTLHSAPQAGLSNNLSSFSANGVTVDHAIVKWDPLGRNYTAEPPSAGTHIANSGDGIIKDDSYLVAALGNSQGSTFLTIGTWNDLGEGTGINRAYDYYVNGAWEPPNYFMDDIRASQGNGSCGVTLPTFTYTPTPTATATPHGPLVADMKNNAANNVTYWNQGSIVQFHDASSTSSVASPPGWTASSGTAPGFGGTDYAACWSGTLAPSSKNPYSFLGFELIPGGSISSSGSGGAWTDVSAYSPNSGFEFEYMAGAAGVQYQVQLTTQEVADYDYYQFKFTAPDAGVWHKVDVYFPGIAAANVLSQVGFGKAVSFVPAHVGAVMFQVIAQSASTPYSLCVDNVTFTCPVPVPPTTPTHGPLVADLENNTANNIDYWNQANVLQYHDGYGTTSSHSPWGPTSGTAPGYGGTGFAGCWSGNLTPTTASAPYPYSFLAFELVPGGSINSTAVGGAWTDVGAYSTNAGLEFEYMAGAAGTLYQVQLTTKEVGADYGYYQYTFAAQNPGTWNKMDIYFPGVATSAVFAQPVGVVQVPFVPAHVGAVIFQVIPQTGVGVPYNLCVDNITFACPPPPTFTPTPTATSSRTPTVTPSASPSVTPSATRTLTPSPSPSPSHTPSGSPSASDTATVLATASPTVTRSASFTPSPSPSVTAQGSFTDSPTVSVSATGTRTSVATPTSSVSASPSVSPSSTRSVSSSPSPSASSTALGTFTDSPTLSPSATWTRTAVATATSSFSVSPSVTPSATPSGSVTVSPSASSTALGSFTDSPTLSRSPSASASPSATSSITVSATLTRTPLGPPTATASATPPSIPTATRSATPTLSATTTPALLATSVATVVSPATVGAPRVLQALAVPNPQRGVSMGFALNLEGVVDHLDLRVYGRSMALLGLYHHEGSLGPGWSHVSFVMDQPLVGGLYFARVSSSWSGSRAGLDYDKVVKIMVLP